MVFLVNKVHQGHEEPLEHLGNLEEMVYPGNLVVQVFQDLKGNEDLLVHQGLPGSQDHPEEQEHLELLVRYLKSFHSIFVSGENKSLCQTRKIILGDGGYRGTGNVVAHQLFKVYPLHTH